MRNGALCGLAEHDRIEKPDVVGSFEKVSVEFVQSRERSARRMSVEVSASRPPLDHDDRVAALLEVSGIELAPRFVVHKRRDLAKRLNDLRALAGLRGQHRDNDK